ILLNEILHQNRTTSVLFKALRPNATGMLDMQDVRRLADQYGAAKPIPQKLAAPNRP
ncbi:MAG: hypothetical protein GWP08_18640, partial [Nitrospiraceae bacterium]|nr:hypothetical protein [Nitrospiraceae bacterium]